MLELVHVRVMLQVVGGEVVSREIVKTPMCELSKEELLCALRIGPAHYKPVQAMIAQEGQSMELAAEG